MFTRQERACTSLVACLGVSSVPWFLLPGLFMFLTMAVYNREVYNRKGGVFFRFCFGNEDASLSTYLLLALAVVFKNLLRSLCKYTLA